MKAERTPTDVTELVEHSMRLVENDARAKNVQIQTQISDLSMLPVDSNQITQALLNLLLNALEAAEPGGHIIVGAEFNASAACLNMWVEDNGPGISPEQKLKIFEPFFTTREKGSGLGLSIVHKIAENHNGEIRLESPIAGKIYGSRFTLMIPLN